LEAWAEDLRGTGTQYGGFVEPFYPVLANPEVFDRILTLAQSAAVSDFMPSSILQESTFHAECMRKQKTRSSPAGLLTVEAAVGAGGNLEVT
jgi:hypothetical protein